MTAISSYKAWLLKMTLRGALVSTDFAAAGIEKNAVSMIAVLKIRKSDLKKYLIRFVIAITPLRIKFK
jgi:hypothetical protein